MVQNARKTCKKADSYSWSAGLWNEGDCQNKPWVRMEGPRGPAEDWPTVWPGCEMVWKDAGPRGSFSPLEWMSVCAALQDVLCCDAVRHHTTQYDTLAPSCLPACPAWPFVRQHFGISPFPTKPSSCHANGDDISTLRGNAL